MILDFSCISGEKGGVWKLRGDLKKENGRDLNLNVTTLGRRQDSSNENFLDIIKRTKKRVMRE